MDANYITVTEFQTMNPEIDFTNYSDATISGMINRASGSIDNYLQHSLDLEEVVGEKCEAQITSQGNLIIFPRKTPVQSVSAIKLKLGTVSLDLNLTDGAGNPRYDIPSRQTSVMYPYQEISMTGVFSVRNFYQLRGVEIYTVISYLAGYETIPPDIKEAVNLWTKDVFMRQANPMDIKSGNQGAINISYRDRDANSGDGTYMKQAKGILQNYRRVVG